MAEIYNEAFFAGMTKSFATAAQYGQNVIQFNAVESARDHAATMAQISANQQLAAIDLAEAEIRDAGVRASMSLQIEAEKSKAAAQTSAAASGTSGNSIDAQINGLERSALNAEYARKQNIENQLAKTGQDRKNVKMAAIFNKDISVATPPSPVAALADVGLTLLENNKENSPKGKSWMDMYTKL